MYSKQRRHDFLAFFTTKKEPVSRQAPKILTKTKLTTKKTNLFCYFVCKYNENICITKLFT